MSETVLFNPHLNVKLSPTDRTLSEQTTKSGRQRAGLRMQADASKLYEGDLSNGIKLRTMSHSKLVSMVMLHKTKPKHFTEPHIYSNPWVTSKLISSLG